MSLEMRISGLQSPILRIFSSDLWSFDIRKDATTQDMTASSSCWLAAFVLGTDLTLFAEKFRLRLRDLGVGPVNIPRPVLESPTFYRCA